MSGCIEASLEPTTRLRKHERQEIQALQVDIVRDLIETLHLHTHPRELDCGGEDLTPGKGERQFKYIGHNSGVKLKRKMLLCYWNIVK